MSSTSEVNQLDKDKPKGRFEICSFVFAQHEASILDDLVSTIFCRCRLNWQLHFGDPPKWAAGVRFILVDVEPSQRDADKAEVVLCGDAAAVAQQLERSLSGLDSARTQAWQDQLGGKVRTECYHACSIHTLC